MPLATSHHGVLPTSEWLLFPATIDIKDKGRPNIISQVFPPFGMIDIFYWTDCLVVVLVVPA